MSAAPGLGAAPTQDVRAEMLKGAQSLAVAAPPSKERGITSDLSVDEALLLHAAGWEPLDLVTGVAVVSVPVGVWNWGRGSISMASDAHDAAVDQASRLLRGECSKVHGHGVVGVRVDVTVNPHHVDVELVGTAVRPMSGKDTNGRAAAGAPTPRSPCRSSPTCRPATSPCCSGPAGYRSGSPSGRVSSTPPAHRRHGHQAEEPERGADQLHRGHVLGPRVRHGEDAALGAGGRGRRCCRGQGDRGPDAFRPARHRIYGVGDGGQTRGRRRTSSSSPR